MEARMEDGVTASEDEDESQEGSEEDEGQEGTDEPSKGYMSDDDDLGQDSASEYEVEGELGVEGESGSDSEEFEDEVVATKKGKSKVDDVKKSKRRSKAKGKEKETVDDDVPIFFDSDYDLSDKEEDEIMAAQVQGWKNVVASMRVIKDRDEEASSDNLPTDSPSEGGSDDDLGGEGDLDIPQVMSRRFKPATDFNDPRWEIGLRFNSKNDFKEVIRHEGVKTGKKLRLSKNDKIRCIAVCRGLERSKKRKAVCPWKITLSHRPTIGC